MSQVIVIGGGPAGMMAAIEAGKKHQVTLLEKNEKLGKKLFITGKGRCNITNVCDVESFLKQIVNNKKFMYSALYSFDSYRTIEFFESNGLKTKLERGNRLFPQSDKSSDVINAFKRALNDSKVNIQLNTTVNAIERDQERFLVKSNQGDYYCDSLIIATGGISYPQTGSTGDGYKFAKAFSHHVTELEPGLIGIEIKDNDIGELQGLSLKNIAMTLMQDQKKLYEDLGEMLFTHFGLSGPVILSASSYMKSGEASVKKSTQKKASYEIILDLKPGLTFEQLDKRLLRDFEAYSNKDVINGLNDLLPKKLIPYIIGRTSIEEHTKVHQITKEQRNELAHAIKNLKFTVKNKYDIIQAVITQGGIVTKEINPNTMESKLIDNLYFVGEVIDVDALTGGYNLQIAYATGYLAGISIRD